MCDVYTNSFIVWLESGPAALAAQIQSFLESSTSDSYAGTCTLAGACSELTLRAFVPDAHRDG